MYVCMCVCMYVRMVSKKILPVLTQLFAAQPYSKSS